MSTSRKVLWTLKPNWLEANNQLKEIGWPAWNGANESIYFKSAKGANEYAELMTEWAEAARNNDEGWKSNVEGQLEELRKLAEVKKPVPPATPVEDVGALVRTTARASLEEINESILPEIKRLWKVLYAPAMLKRWTRRGEQKEPDLELPAHTNFTAEQYLQYKKLLNDLLQTLEEGGWGKSGSREWPQEAHRALKYKEELVASQQGGRVSRRKRKSKTKRRRKSKTRRRRR